MSDKKFKVGDKVKYKGNKHNMFPSFYPEVGSIGTIDDVYECCIQWAKNSTSGDDKHWCSKNDIELVEDTDMTNEEIWKMLENKMEKNGLISKANLIHVSADNYPNNEVKITKTYLEDDVHNAIALAYKVGYLRAMKGRPFKIGEKKKKGGHWEPVDPKNLPEEGTRVRYSRQICFEDEFYLIGWNVGDEGIVNYHGNYFGVKREGKNWDGVGMFGYYFDMWVEDDE